MIHLFYLTGRIYGGWMTYTSHFGRNIFSPRRNSSVGI